MMLEEKEGNEEENFRATHHETRYEKEGQENHAAQYEGFACIHTRLAPLFLFRRISEQLGVLSREQRVDELLNLEGQPLAIDFLTRDKCVFR